MPSISQMTAMPLGTRASKSSSTRGRPIVMSLPTDATPPVWNVRMVSRDDVLLVGEDEDVVLVARVGDAQDDVLRHVHQTAREVARVGRPDRGVGQALAATMRRDEVREDRQALAEVRTDRQVDDAA